MIEVVNSKVLRLAEHLGVPIDSRGRLVGLLDMVNELRKRGHVFVLKWDGERDTAAGDNGPFTAIISGGAMAGEFFRRDDETLEGAVESVLASYVDWMQGR